MQTTQFLFFCFTSLILIIKVYCKDYYQILGVSKGDSIPQIKKAFRNLALKYHPGILLLLIINIWP